MAWNNTAQAAEYVSSGAGGVRSIYTTKRKYSLSDLVVYQDRSDAMLDFLLREKGSVITVDDPEPKVFTKQETPITFSVHSDDTDTTYEGDTLRISDTSAKWLQQYDVLMCPDIFCDSDGANYSTTKYSSGYMPETMVVNNVTLSGADSGIATVNVTRGNGYAQASVAAGTVQTVLTEYKLIKQTNAMEDGWTAVTAKWGEPTDEQNYIQTFDRTWAETELQANTNMYAKETMSDKAVRNRRDFLREIEFAFFRGRKGKHVVNGQFQYTTGGILEFVPAAATALDGISRIIDFGGALDLEKLREKAEIIYRYGSETKWWFTGAKFMTVLLNMLEKFIVANDKLSARWGWKVYELELGHGVAQIMVHPMYREMDKSNNDYAYDIAIVDPNYVDLMVMNNMDIRVKTNVQDNDQHQQKDEITASLGLRRTHPTAHAIIHGITG